MKRAVKHSELCVCGRPFGWHGAAPPHTSMGSEEGRLPCAGFVPAPKARRRK